MLKEEVKSKKEKKKKTTRIFITDDNRPREKRGNVNGYAKS